jgi:O-antigen ligase
MTLWDISVLGAYGAGEGGQFMRAIGPFTHPVGAGHYFVLPLLLSVAAAFDASRRNAGWRSTALYLALAILFAAAVITTISRGSWLAAGLGVLLVGVFYRRVLITLVALAAVGLFLALVPPFSLSISSALSASDSSVVAHSSAIEKGIKTVTQNPFGLGVGQGDQPGFAFGGEEGAAGVGENMYLSLLVTVGPVGLAAFLAWFLGMGWTLFASLRRSPHWLVAGTLAALVGYGASAATASPLMRFTTSAHFWLLLGLVIAANSQRRSSPESGSGETEPVSFPANGSPG